MVRLAIKNRHIKELYEELAGARLSAAEVRAVREVGRRKVTALEEERDRLLQRLVQEARRQPAARGRPAAGTGEAHWTSGRPRWDGLRRELEEEYELRTRLAEPENRLRGRYRAVQRVRAPPGGKQPLTVYGTTGGTRRARRRRRASGNAGFYVAGHHLAGLRGNNPGLAVEEPRVYLESSGEDLSGVTGERRRTRTSTPGEWWFWGFERSSKPVAAASGAGGCRNVSLCALALCLLLRPATLYLSCRGRVVP